MKNEKQSRLQDVLRESGAYQREAETTCKASYLAFPTMENPDRKLRRLTCKTWFHQQKSPLAKQLWKRKTRSFQGGGPVLTAPKMPQWKTSEEVWRSASRPVGQTTQKLSALRRGGRRADASRCSAPTWAKGTSGGRGRGLATPMRTRPRGAPFRACTAASSPACCSGTSLTKSNRSPGIRRPSCWATPPGTRLRITITVSLGFIGSW